MEGTLEVAMPSQPEETAAPPRKMKRTKINAISRATQKELHNSTKCGACARVQGRKGHSVKRPRTANGGYSMQRDRPARVVVSFRGGQDFAPKGRKEREGESECKRSLSLYSKRVLSKQARLPVCMCVMFGGLSSAAYKVGEGGGRQRLLGLSDWRVIVLKTRQPLSLSLPNPDFSKMPITQGTIAMASPALFLCMRE